MNHRIKKFSVPLALVITTVLVASVAGRHVFAAGGSIYLSPASASVLNGSNITLNLRINPGTSINTAVANVNYDTSKLTYVSYTIAGSPLNIPLSVTSNGGTINFQTGILGGSVSSDSFVAAITFQARAGSGSSAITISGQYALSQIDGSTVNLGATGATVNFTSPAVPPATCPVGQTGTPPNCVTPVPVTPPSTAPPSNSTNSPTNASTNTTNNNTPNSPAPPTSGTSGSTIPSQSNPNAPKVSSNNATAQYTQAIVAVSSDTPTTAYIKFGLDGQLNITTPVGDLSTQHNIVLDEKYLVPGETYTYAVVLTDQAGNVTQTVTKTIQTKGLPLRVKIVDKDGNPLKSKKVTFHSTPQTVTTDSSGYATITDASPGIHTVIYESEGKQYKQEITVVNNIKNVNGVQTAAVQNFSVAYNLKQSNVSWIPYGGGVLIVLLFAAFGYLFVRRKRSNLSAAVVSNGPVDPQLIVTSDNYNEQLERSRQTSVPYPSSTPGTVDNNKVPTANQAAPSEDNRRANQ